MSEIKEFKCPNCGGKIEFDTTTQKMKCPYCDGVFDPEVFDAGNEFVLTNEPWVDNDLILYSCNSCGGQIMADKDTVASSCPYCGNPVVNKGNVTGALKPKKIIPFKYDKQAAKDNYRKFLKGKTLLPNKFRSETTIDEIKGIYVPYWIFDGKARAHIWFDATKVRRWSEGQDDVVETSHYKLYRSGSVVFSKIPVDGTDKIEDIITESIEPFDYKESKDFNENYLSGYYADKFNVDANSSRTKANNRIANSVPDLFAKTTAMYDTCIASSSNISIINGNQEYVMYPVWLLNVKYMGKMYTFAMNGQTGKFIGELPSDNGKLAYISIGVFTGVMALVSLLQFLFMR